MVVEIELSKNGTKYRGLHKALVSDEDKEFAELNWNVQVGNTNNYAVRKVGNEPIFLHRIIMQKMLGHEIPDKMVVDHADRNGLNNQRNNLRLATYSQNAANKILDMNGSTGYTGVSQIGENRYEASISISLGTFDNAEDAYIAYRQAHIERYKEFSPYYGLTWRYWKILVDKEVRDTVLLMLTEQGINRKPPKIGTVMIACWEEPTE